MRSALLLGLALAAGCASTLDHQAELLLNENPPVQVAALVGAVPGTILGAPLWGPAALLCGPEADVPGYLLHVFAYPGELLLAGIPWLLTL
jgi:hypothetical protein